MIIASLAISIATALIELFTKGRGIVIIPYGFVIPLLILLPRFFYYFDAKIKKTVKVEWMKKIEYFAFFIVLLSAPASLILHDLGFQYDRFLHFAVAFFALIIFSLLWLPVMKISGEEVKKRNLLLYLFAVLFVALFLWEILQYNIDQLFGTKLFFDAKQEIKVDFLEDILFGAAGLIAAVIYLNFSLKKFSGLLISS
ncbi:hypothetical protein KJA13_00920 [Patescibacteria group bacterium]|nr:hypothetical protein [Patescibacteria group bacterium]